MTDTTAPLNYANEYGYSDVTPYEIVRRVTDKTIEVREMDAVLAPGWKPEFIPGGFAGHCINQSSQEWVYTSRPEAPVIRIRLTKKGWAHKGSRFKLADKPRKFYDYNF